MRTTPATFALLAIGLLALPDRAAAQRASIKIVRAQVGFPAGPYSSEGDAEGGKRPLFRAGTWTPIWVDLECHADTKEPLELVVETADADDVVTVGRVPLAPMQKDERRAGHELGVIPYLKPGHSYGKITVSVRTVKGQRSVAETYERSIEAFEPGKYFIVSVGSSLKGLWLPKNEGADPQEGADRERTLRGGQVQLAEILEPGQMPDQWFGYAGVDLVILTTGQADPAFWDRLASDRRRVTALAEWVRRGGRLVVSAGANADLLNSDALREIREALPATVPPGGKHPVDSVHLSWTTHRASFREPLAEKDARQGKLFLAALNPRADRGARVLMPAYEGNDPDPSKPLMVQGPYGLGRVTLVGFDLDRPPLTDWQHRGAFWDWFITEAGHRLPTGQERSGGFDPNEDVYLGRMQEMLDSFEGVPVISFGWVALFILIYILLIGPVDYYFLKKVAKRMEWTWVTFPLIVVAVSAVAYFAAYSLKGRDLKINKLDLVDVDLQTNRVYGHTWFTVFSPRIQSYTVGVEPAGPEAGASAGTASWTPEPGAESVASTVVSWHGRVKTGGNTQVFRRTYRYRSEVEDPARLLYASGLEGVPIQVWSTKSFGSAWSAKQDPARPLIEHTLRHPADDPKSLVGTVTSRLPAEVLADAYLLYQDKAIHLGQLIPGVDRVITQKPTDRTIANALDRGLDQMPGRQQEYDPDGRPRQAAGAAFGSYRLWPVLFAERFGAGGGHNASLRNLDQSWRVAQQNTDQAILVLKFPTTDGPAEEMTRSAQSPTRLWLNALPGGETPRESLSGTLRQETYVRVFITIPPAQTAKK